MAFTGSFSISQSASDFTSVTLVDTSDYSDEGAGTFSGRKIYLYKIDATTLVPSGTTTTYIDFPFSAGSSITISGVLQTDYALLVNVTWSSNSPQSGSIYTADSIESFVNYIRDFESSLIGALSSNPNLLRDTNWYDSLGAVQTEIDNALKSASDGQQFQAQAALDRANDYKRNQNKFF